MVSNVRASIGVSALIGLTLSALLMLMATAPAQAQTCQTKIDELKSLTAEAKFLGTNDEKAEKAKANLLLKLDEANAKLEKVKYQDAIDKLTDFQNTVIALDAGSKIDSGDASILIAGAEEAKGCVRGLQAQTATV
jgi:hypothetical protein